MFLIPKKPFNEIEKFFEDEDFFPVLSSERWHRFPKTDIYEDENNVIAEMEIPNIDLDKIDISLKDNILNVKGQSEEETEEKEKNYYKKEIRKGYFERSFAIPVNVVDDKTKASYKDGILKVVMPKVDGKMAKESKIKVEREK